MSFEELQNIIVDTLACDAAEVTPEANLVEDLKIDSLSLVELHMALEDASGRSIPDGEIGKLQTVQDILDYIQKAE